MSKHQAPSATAGATHERPTKDAKQGGARGATGKLARWLPPIMLAFALLYLMPSLRPVSDTGAFRTAEFGRLPIVDQGRIKPLDTFARISLMVLSNKQTLYMGGDEGSSERERGLEKTPAVEWLLDVMAKPEQARHYKVVRIDHPDVLALLEADRDTKYFAVHDLLHHSDVLNDQISRALQTESGDRTPFHRALARLSQQLSIYFSIEEVTNLLVVPPAPGTEEWRAPRDAQSQFSDELPAEVEALATTLTAWNEQNAADFNSSVTGFGAELDSRFPETMGKVGFEQYYNQAAPFINAMFLYVLVFLLAIFSWLGWSRPLSNAGMWVAIVALILHTAGLIARIYIQDRPPVTNLYSSAIFTGWGAVIIGLILERLFRNGVGLVTAAVTGFTTLLVAHNLSTDGDTMTMMQAVLDTNFWLATHVVVITLGYSATFLAGFLGTLFILRGVFTRALVRDEARNLTRMIYGIICFGTLFSFVGTILGGIWADQSWGRFWGWDPKENGALLIVLWNALVLHARWGGMIKQRGLAGLAVAGNIVTAWSWFGTNMLGVGLHSYGFIDKALLGLLTFIGSQLLIIGIGMIPLSRWRSPIGRSQDTGPTDRGPGPGARPHDAPLAPGVSTRSASSLDRES